MGVRSMDALGGDFVAGRGSGPSLSGKRWPITVDEYIAAAPPGARLALERLRELIKAAAPGSSEVIRYRMPVIRHEGRQLSRVRGIQGPL